MLEYPHFDPIIYSFGPYYPFAYKLGPFAIRWYGMMYVLGFLQCWLLGRWRLKTRPAFYSWNEKDFDDLLFYGVLGVIIGGRLGEVLFYHPGYYFSHPSEIFMITKGGMSFHGGFLGVLLAFTYWARKLKLSWLAVADFVAPLMPLGLFFGRIGNFINGELWGRLAGADLPWAMIFAHVDNRPRHPSQLYEALLEGLALFAILWIYSRRPRPAGTVAALFLIGYGSFRFICEFFREPDAGIFGYSAIVSMGQWLSLPMIVAGIVMFVYCSRAARNAGPVKPSSTNRLG